MEGQDRREKILEILHFSNKPISGASLARTLNVSRQIIVQDIALLRASNSNIYSTNKGYIVGTPVERETRVFHVWHTASQIEDELNTIIDLGGRVLDVIVTHKVYGEISAKLILNNRQDIIEFTDKIKEYKGIPLMDLSDGTHMHTVEADSVEILDRIERALNQKNYLLME